MDAARTRLDELAECELTAIYMRAYGRNLKNAGGKLFSSELKNIHDQYAALLTIWQRYKLHQDPLSDRTKHKLEKCRITQITHDEWVEIETPETPSQECEIPYHELIPSYENSLKKALEVFFDIATENADSSKISDTIDDLLKCSTRLKSVSPKSFRKEIIKVDTLIQVYKKRLIKLCEL